MSRKRGEYQKRKERQNKLTGMLCIILLLFVILFFSYCLVQEAVNISDINHNALKRYTGTCSYEYHRGYGRHGNNYYVLTLDNGDAVYVSNKLIENKDHLNHYAEFTIQYSSVYSNPFYRRYSAVTITSADGTTSFLSIDRAKGRSIEAVWICSLMLLLLVGLLTAYLLLIYTVYRKQRNIKSQNKQTKTKSKQKRSTNEARTVQEASPCKNVT